MAKHRTVNEFYSSLLANHAVTLDPRWQRRIVTYANANRRHHLLAGLLKRSDVDEAIVDELAGHRAAAVKSAWLARHVDDIDVITAAIDGETRGAVLASVVTEENLPDSVFDRIVADADGVDLILAIIGTGRAEPDSVYALIERVASRPKLAADGVVRRLSDKLEVYPELFDPLVRRTRNHSVLRVAIPRASEKVTVTEMVAAGRRALERILDREPGDELTYSEIGTVLSLFGALAETVGAEDEMIELVEEYAPRVRSFTTQLGASHYQARQLESLEETIFDSYDQLAVTLDGTDAQAARVLSAARKATAAQIAAAQNHWQRGPTAGQRRLCTRILCDTRYSDGVRAEAIEQLVENAGGVSAALFRTLAERRTPLTVAMAERLHTRIQYGMGFTELLECVDDQAALIEALVTGQLSCPLLVALDERNLLSDDIVTLAGEAVPARWFAELPMEHPAVVRVVEAGLAATVDELGTNDDGWEFFEACYGTVAANPAVLAKLASANG